MSNARNLANLLGTGSTIATAKIADDAITAAKIATDAVVADGLKSDAIQHGDLPTGAILQVVSSTKTGVSNFSTISFSDVSDLNVSITPSSTSNKVLVICHLSCGAESGFRFAARLVRGSSDILNGDSAGSRSRASVSAAGTGGNPLDETFCISHLDSPSTTSATTYKITVAAEQSGGLSVNKGHLNTDNNTIYRVTSAITAIEVAG